METLLINIKSEKDKSLFSELAKRLHLKTTVLSDEDKEDYGLLKAMLKGRTGQYVDKKIILKALRK
ncbi:MAG: hypothetical protein HYR91_09245 [Flavobacteriia bacterium]|nr:hypothetical protein [Flavobacteriia bacterium]